MVRIVQVVSVKPQGKSAVPGQHFQLFAVFGGAVYFAAGQAVRKIDIFIGNVDERGAHVMHKHALDSVRPAHKQAMPVVAEAPVVHHAVAYGKRAVQYIAPVIWACECNGKEIGHAFVGRGHCRGGLE
jgi:hypothetical protein